MSDDDSHRCVAGRRCRNPEKTDEGQRQPAITELPDTLCPGCTKAVAVALDDIVETWAALHASIGDQTRRQTQKVAGSRAAPINLNTDVDALKVAIVEWLTAAAARLAEAMKIDDPRPRNNTDVEHARVIAASTRIIAPNLDRLLAMPADYVMIWQTAADTDHPGEYHDGRGRDIIAMTGAELGLKLADVRNTARTLLALTTPRDKLPLPCPGCNENELVRTHRTINLVGGNTKDVDQIDCDNCGLSWPYERYRQLCLIWVKEDEMEREKLQKKLDGETKRRELIEWLLAEREWQLGLVDQFPDVRARDFVTAVTDQAADDVYMTDRDIAIYLQVSEATVRSWAHRGHIQRHTADDGSTTYLASEVWNYAKHRDTEQTAGRCGVLTERPVIGTPKEMKCKQQ